MKGSRNNLTAENKGFFMDKSVLDVTLSCGHREATGHVLVFWKDMVVDWYGDSNFVRSVSYGAVCKKCYQEMLDNDLILNEDERDKWTSGKLPDPSAWW